MKRTSDAEQIAEPIFAVAMVLGERELGALHALVSRLAPESVSVVVWRPEAEPLESDAVPAELARSRFFVQTLVDGDELEAGVLYLAPARARLWYEGRALRVAASGSSGAPPIDRFLQTFADGWGPRAIAIMPRALGSRSASAPRADGSLGESFDGASGLAAIQAVRGIALGPSAFDTKASPQSTQGQVNSFARLGTFRGAFDDGAAAAQPSVRGRRLQRLLALTPVASALVSAAASSALQRTAARGHLRVWVPCCKQGTLVYGIAMLLLEAIASSGARVSLQVFGTDADEHALGVARSGRYPTSSALGIDPVLRGRYLFDEGETVRVAEALREVCVFSSHKLTRDAPLSRMDLLVCQHVLDGLTPSKRARAVDALSFALREGGELLALDHGEDFPPLHFEELGPGHFRARTTRAKGLSPLTIPSAAGPLEKHRAERVELESFVRMIGVLLILCDEELRVQAMSKEALAVLPLSEGDRGRPLHALADRLPGGVDLVHAARRSLSSKATEELSIRSEQQAFLARITASSHSEGGRVAIVLTDVTALEAAKARAVAQQHQQAAVARVGARALSPLPQSEVFEEALSVLFGNVPVCSAGLILECVEPGVEPRVVAARGLGAQPLAALRALGPASSVVDTAIERGILVAHEGEATAARLVDGIACPIVHEGAVLGVIALYARQSDIDAPDHRHFIQAVANVLGGAVVRHRTRRRLALELEVASVLASATDLDAMASGVARALRQVMPHERVELWLPSSGAPGAWVRHSPATSSEHDDGFSPGHARGTVRYQPALTEGAQHTLALTVRSSDTPLALVRVLGRELPPPDSELCAGLERVTTMIGDFIDRLEILQSLQQSEARYKRHSAELESLYRALQTVEVNLREIDRQKDDFLAMLGHELRNPMAAIRNATELLGQVETAEPRVERLQSVFARQTQQMTKLVDGLLDVSRVARGKVELQLAPVPLGELSRQVVDDRRPEFKDRQIELRLPDDELWALADRVRLVQVLDNLLSNACKFTPGGGHVSVELSRVGERGRLTVSDDGMGIEAEVLPRLFEPFRQGRAALGHSQGLGLGLAMVKGLVELHGFELDVHSDGPGRGSLFRVDFPLTTAPDAQPPESSFEPRGLELLLVEDNADVAETLAELLAASGHSVETVSSGEQALSSLRSHQPAVVLCDIGLPGMDGLALAQHVRSDPTLADVQLVAMTGYSDAATRQRMENAGFSRLLIKPVQLSALRHCLARLDRERTKSLTRR